MAKSLLRNPLRVEARACGRGHRAVSRPAGRTPDGSGRGLDTAEAFAHVKCRSNGKRRYNEASNSGEEWDGPVKGELDARSHHKQALPFSSRPFGFWVLGSARIFFRRVVRILLRPS